MVYARCKAPLVWTNTVRGALLTDAETTLLDSLTSSGSQFGGIAAASYCALFSNASLTLCSGGCQPLPQDYQTRWSVQYHPNSPNDNMAGAPIVSNPLYSAGVACRAGYAVVAGSSTVDAVSCGAAGWTPSNLTLLVTCGPGCPEVVVQSGAVVPPPRNQTGAAPYTIGDTLEVVCGDGLVVAGSQQLVCTSLMRWKPAAAPLCVTRTSVSSSHAHRRSVAGLWAVWAVFGLILLL